jgi:hypothetical protein
MLTDFRFRSGIAAVSPRQRRALTNRLFCLGAWAFAAMSVPAQGRVWIVDARDRGGRRRRPDPRAQRQLLDRDDRQGADDRG